MTEQGEKPSSARICELIGQLADEHTTLGPLDQRDLLAALDELLELRGAKVEAAA